jgi:hypothetical protein
MVTSGTIATQDKFGNNTNWPIQNPLIATVSGGFYDEMGGMGVAVVGDGVQIFLNGGPMAAKNVGYLMGHQCRALCELLRQLGKE